MDKLVNFILFQAGWFACVLFGTTPYHLMGPLIVGLIIAYHLMTVPGQIVEKNLLLSALMIGVVWESLLTASGLLTYAQGQFVEWLAPVWIMFMWPLLAITLNVSLRWMKDRFWLSVVFGAIGGPAAFLAGERLGAVSFSDTFVATLVLAAGWAVLFPLLMRLSSRYDGFAMNFDKTLREAS